jgi:hypothetical protein
MSRRSFLLAVAILLCLTSGVGASLWMLVRYEPNKYLRAAVPPGEERHRMSDRCLHKILQMYNSVVNQPDELEWEHRFTDGEINSYLTEDFMQSRIKDFPEGISDPRVIIEQNNIRIAFRYGSGLWSTVVSIDLHFWLVKDEPNVVAMKLAGFHAGALPISSQSLLDGITKTCQDNGVRVDWYRDGGAPVALLRFQADQQHPTLELETIEIEPGSIHIQGRTKDPASLNAFLAAPFSGIKLVMDRR